MPYKNKEDQKRAWREHYARNKKRYYDRNKKRRDALRDWLISLKEGKPCTRCNGYFHFKALDWHHKDATDKLFNVSDALNNLYGKERILQEIEKCELICANCHRIMI